MSDSEIVSINVGGNKYQMTLDLIKQYPTSLLATTILNNKENAQKHEGAFFFDGNKELFVYIEQLLKKGELFIPKHIPIDMMKKELDYWGFEWDEEQVRYENCAEKFQEQVEKKVQERIDWFVKRCLEHSLLKKAKDEGFYQQTFIMNNAKHIPFYKDTKDNHHDITPFIKTVITENIPNIKKEIESLNKLKEDIDNLKKIFLKEFPTEKDNTLRNFLSRLDWEIQYPKRVEFQ